VVGAVCRKAVLWTDGPNIFRRNRMLPLLHTQVSLSLDMASIVTSPVGHSSGRHGSIGLTHLLVSSCASESLVFSKTALNVQGSGLPSVPIGQPKHVCYRYRSPASEKLSVNNVNKPLDSHMF
jgi:hypothetical protein